MGVDARVGSPKGALGQVGPRDAMDVAGEEVHAIFADVEVGHKPMVVGKVRGAVGQEGRGLRCWGWRGDSPALRVAP